MQHTDSSIKIYYTKDYSLFKKIDGNRELNGGKIERILSDINNGLDLLRYCPILVVNKNGCLEIIDGQHRFYVARKIKSAVWYIIAEDLSLYEIARMNSNTSKWKGKDFIYCYSQLDNSHYKQLQDFLDKYPIPISTAINLLSNAKVPDGGGHEMDKFEKGEFEINNLEFATNLLETCKRFSFAGNLKRPFIRVIKKIVDAAKIDVDYLIQKANNNIKELEFATGEKAYLIALENIYNKGKQNRELIY